MHCNKIVPLFPPSTTPQWYTHFARQEAAVLQAQYGMQCKNGSLTLHCWNTFKLALFGILVSK